MGKRKDERERIIAIIDWHAQDCESGRQTLAFDAKEKTTKGELKRQAQRLRWLIRQIEGK